MGWPSENHDLNVRRLRSLLRKRGGRMVIPCNFESTRAAAETLARTDCEVVFGKRDATIRLLSPEEIEAKIKAGKKRSDG